MHRSLTPFAAALSIAMLGLVPAAQAQSWTPLLNDGYGWYFKLSVLDSRQLFVEGLPGTLLRSTDGGSAWTISDMPRQKFGWNLQAISPDTIWLSSNDSLYRSVDGGMHWSFRKPPDVLAYFYQFLNGTQGFMVAMGGGLYATLDGGVTWTLRKAADRKGLVSLNFLDPMRGFGLSADSSGTFPWNYTALQTVDSGKTWMPLILPADIQVSPTAFKTIHFTSPLQGTVAFQTTAGQGLELSTLDGGVSWSRREIPNHDSISVYGSIGTTFLYGNDYHGFRSKFVISRDGGTTWIPVKGDFPARLEDMEWVHPDTGWAIGPGFVYKTTDGGKTWARQIATLSDESSASDLLFRTPLAGWAIDGKKVYATANGGRTWSLQATSDTTYWSSLYPADSTVTPTLLALGSRYRSGAAVNYSVIGVSKDLGLTMKETLLDSLVQARGMSFGSAQTGYVLVTHTALDSLGLIKTADGGASWQFVRLPYRSRAFSGASAIQFLNEDEGFVAAYGVPVDSLLILRIIQGGAASSVVARFPKTGFAGMRWEDAQRGWVLSRDTVYKTVDGGAVWSKSGLGTWKGSTRVVATDARNAAVYADSAKLLRTTDGFTTWSVEKLPMNLIHDLQFFPTGEGYALGGQGELMRYGATTVSLRRVMQAIRSGTGKAEAKFGAGGMRFLILGNGGAVMLPVDAKGRRIGAP